MRYLAVVLGMLSLHAHELVAMQERIISFKSDIIVSRDASLHVTETITVFSAGQAIIHGIVREFPTRYRDYGGTTYNVLFDLQQVIQDGVPAQYVIRNIKNGKKIFIGDRGKILPMGEHTYSISYTTNRQLGFFDHYDELYWNVTGNGWRLPIEQVHATVHLPQGTVIRSAECYTGAQGEKGSACTHTVQGDTVLFSTTRPFQPFQGLTIVVTWPKGIVHEPSWFQKIFWFFKDNGSFIAIILGVLLLWLLVVYGWYSARIINKPGTIIPLFYPPIDLMPSAVGFMKNRRYKQSLLAADIVDLAVRGFITISHEKTFWRGSRYTLAATKATEQFLAGGHLDAHDAPLLKTLFAQGTSVVIEKNNRDLIDKVQKHVKKYCASRVGCYTRRMKRFYIAGYVLAGLLGFAWVFFNPFAQYGRELIGLVRVLPVLLVVGALGVIHKLRVYTKEGRKLQDEIDGFELYLVTAETERMQVIGTPPTRTPELYEKYLPYAIALGVEKQWSRQFVPVFERLEREGHPYVPIWYIGTFRGDLFASSFASEFGSSFNAAIFSASTPPGRSSGSGGRGSSGGGGGGGGGGGW
jgi:uncharacterized membrane protein YgcG